MTGHQMPFLDIRLLPMSGCSRWNFAGGPAKPGGLPLTLVGLPLRNDATKSAPRSLRITLSPWNDMEMRVQDSLSRARAIIRTEIEAGYRSVHCC
jgi:hypothetical protein